MLHCTRQRRPLPHVPDEANTMHGTPLYEAWQLAGMAAPMQCEDLHINKQKVLVHGHWDLTKGVTGEARRQRLCFADTLHMETTEGSVAQMWNAY